MAVLISFLVGAYSIGQGENRGARAREIEAAFLIQFSKYVTWPDSAFIGPDDPITVGILGRDPFGSILDTIAFKTKVDGRDIEIRRFADITSLKNSHILFVTSTQADRMDEITKILGNSPVLLVGDSEGFLRFGTINFVIVDNKIRFNISRKNCKKSGLKISSKLLKVAHTVED